MNGVLPPLVHESVPLQVKSTYSPAMAALSRPIGRVAEQEHNTGVTLGTQASP